MLRLFWIGFGLFLIGDCAHGSELFAPAPIDEVSVRTLPGFSILEADTTGSLDSAWEKGFRLGARYAASAGSGLNTPTILTFPDWEKTPSADGKNVHLLAQCLLDPLPNLPPARDEGAMLREMPTMTVACYAQRGDYSPAAFLDGLHKIEAYMKTRHIPQAGPPRYLYYTTTRWVPSWWRIGEVEVPIAAGAGN